MCFWEEICREMCAISIEKNITKHSFHCENKPDVSYQSLFHVSCIYLLLGASCRFGALCISPAASRRLLCPPSDALLWETLLKCFLYSRWEKAWSDLPSSADVDFIFQPVWDFHQKFPSWKLVSDGGLEYCHPSSTIWNQCSLGGKCVSATSVSQQ